MIVAGLLAGGFFIASITKAIDDYGWLLFILFLVIACVSVYRYTKKEDVYTGDFKKNVIGEIVAYLNPGIVYKPEGYVSSKEYKRSSLYRKSYDYYEGDDLLQGKYKGVSFIARKYIHSIPVQEVGQEQFLKGSFL